MTFSHRLKKELCEIRPFNRELQYAQLSGLLMFCKEFDKDIVLLSTEYIEIAEYFTKLVRHIFKYNSEIYKAQKLSNVDVVLYTVSITESNIVDKLNEMVDNISDFINSTEAVSAFIRGAFLACGTITDPEKSYHIEFVTQYENYAEFLCDIISNLSINAKISKRKGNFVVYLKESTNIEDLVTSMGATKSTLALMDVKVYKDMRNKVNRITNCETANLNKTVTASAKQIEDIKKIANSVGLDSLGDDLKQLAKIRLKNPDMSLSEIATAVVPPISRSGVNHRFKKISEIASKIK